MKTLKNYLTIAFMFLITFLASSQEQVSISVYQDAKLLITGDNIGNSAGTLNVVLKANLQGNQQQYGYMIVSPEFEYANLKGGEYQRYSANVGYVFNKLILNNFEAGITAGWGWINRDNFTFHSASINGLLNYKINNRFKISTQLQLVDRTDLEIPELRLSGFIGLEITL